MDIDIEEVIIYGICGLLLGYLVWFDLIIPVARWIDSHIPYGWEDEAGFHYGEPPDKS